MPPMPARQAFALARIVVVPSRAESLPYLVLEAAAAGHAAHRHQCRRHPGDLRGRGGAPRPARATPARSPRPCATALDCPGADGRAKPCCAARVWSKNFLLRSPRDGSKTSIGRRWKRAIAYAPCERGRRRPTSLADAGTGPLWPSCLLVFSRTALQPFDVRSPVPSRAARSREHPHHPRSCRRVPQPGDALFDRQGFLGHAASGAEGVLPGAAAVSR